MATPRSEQITVQASNHVGESGLRKEVKQYVLECKRADIHIGKFHILKSIDAAFVPGQLTALMGPSGSGKTTLMNAMSGRGLGRVTSGEILINGEQVSKKMVRKISCLVPQLDVLFAVLTCRESLEYTARLALNLSREERTKRVTEVIESLSLTGVEDILVGNEDIKGLSGGERKRVSIGIELLSNPSIMFLDEPTSGLDAKIAKDVVELLKNLASEKRTIICTIHQPSFQVFSIFNNLVLLNKGHVVYNGLIDQVSSYFESLGLPVPQFTNPADHMLEILSSSDTTSNQPFDVKFLGSQFKTDFEHYAEEASNLAKQFVSDSMISHNGSSGLKNTCTNWVRKFYVLFARSTYITYKDKQQFRARILQTLVISLIVGALYFDLANIQQTRFDRQSLLFIVCLFATMATLMGTVITLPIEKAMIKREYGNGYFATGSFYLARTLVLYVYQTFLTTLLTIILYPMVNLAPGVENVLVFYVTLMVLSYLSISLGYLFGTLFPNVTAATATVPTLLIPLVFFSGLFISPENIPGYFVWLYYLSFLQYAYSIFVINEFKDRMFEPCTPEELLTPGECPLGACNDAPFNFSLPAESCSGELVVENLGYSVDELLLNFGILILFWAFIVLAGYLILWRYLRQG